MNIKYVGHWVRDYLYLFRGQSYSFIFRKPPRHYLGHVKEGFSPVILIPGVFEKWQFLKAIADPISLLGHPVYVLEHLGYNTGEIFKAAKLVRELIDEEKLKNVVIIAHSKGGLIGKYVLAFYDEDKKVKKLISIATPYKGSTLAKISSARVFRELLPGNAETIQKLHNEKDVNRHIVSIYGIFDNHVWPQGGCHLEGAKNIQVNTHGHHHILFDKRVRSIVLEEVGDNRML